MCVHVAAIMPSIHVIFYPFIVSGALHRGSVWHPTGLCDTKDGAQIMPTAAVSYQATLTAQEGALP